MFIYQVTVNVPSSIAEEWYSWMKEVHIPDVMKTGIFTHYQFCKCITSNEAATVFQIHYFFRHQEDFEKYQQQFAPQLQQEHQRRFPRDIKISRVLWEVL